MIIYHSSANGMTKKNHVIIFHENKVVMRAAQKDS